MESKKILTKLVGRGLESMDPNFRQFYENKSRVSLNILIRELIHFIKLSIVLNNHPISRPPRFNLMCKGPVHHGVPKEHGPIEPPDTIMGGVCHVIGYKFSRFVGIKGHDFGESINKLTKMDWTDSVDWEINRLNKKGKLMTWLTNKNIMYVASKLNGKKWIFELPYGHMIRDIFKGMTYDHGLVIDMQRNAWSFGGTDKGKRGINDMYARYERPTRFINPSGHPVIQTACGYQYSIILDTIGAVYFAGTIGLGNGGITRYKPTKIGCFGDAIHVISIDSGCQFFTCLDKHEQVWVVGMKWINECLIKADAPKIELKESLKPLLLNNLTDLGIRIKYLDCGSGHVMFIDDKGRLYGCGWNACNELGMRHRNRLLGIHLVLGLAKQVVVKVTCGNKHSIAKTDNGHWYGWGYCRFSNLNKLINNTSEKNEHKRVDYICVPMRLDKLNELGDKVIDVFCGDSDTTVLIKQ